MEGKNSEKREKKIERERKKRGEKVRRLKMMNMSSSRGLIKQIERGFHDFALSTSLPSLSLSLD